MSRIFISYRRDDTASDMTDRLYERLVRRWGRRVFMDIDSLVGGDLFAKAIEENLQNCAVVLVMIGRYWTSLTDKHGARRIDDPGDYPRMEVAAALRRGIRVIPVIVGNVPLPTLEELPEELMGLLERQVVRISRERFDADVQRLITAVACEMPTKSWRDLPGRGIAAALLVVGIAAGAYFAFVDTSANRGSRKAVVPPSISKHEPPIAGRSESEAVPPAIVTAPKAEEKKAANVTQRDPLVNAKNKTGDMIRPAAANPQAKPPVQNTLDVVSASPAIIDRKVAAWRKAWLAIGDVDSLAIVRFRSGSGTMLQYTNRQRLLNVLARLDVSMESKLLARRDALMEKIAAEPDSKGSISQGADYDLMLTTSITSEMLALRQQIRDEASEHGVEVSSGMPKWAN